MNRPAPLFLEENHLIRQLQKADETAFRYFVASYQSKVYNTIISIVQETNEAEDLTQEVFIEVYESVHQFRGDAKLSTWVYRIATQKAVESLRKRKTQKRFAFLSSLFGKEDQYQVSDFVHPGVALENQERAKILFKHIGQLADNQKVAFTLCHVEGLSYQEIAEVMQVSLSAVESLIHRAKQNLRKSLKSYYSLTD
ncbi:MAG: sigma-70 family RNA polymerase sigma factor [Spirosomataceae bacterium]